MRERRTECVKYYAPQEHYDKVLALAKERRCSVSRLINDILFDHLRAKLSVEKDPQRRAAIQRALDAGTGPLWKRPVVDYAPGGYVYLVKCGTRYKIGRAKKLEKRLAGIQFPEKPRLIKAVRCLDYGFLEKALHALFAHKRGHGEWFCLSDEDLLQAKQYMESRAKPN